MSKQDNNMNIWNAVCETDPKFTKKVNVRGGFTTVDAYHQILQATELWGPYGSHWGLSDLEYSFHEHLCILKAKFSYPWNGEKVCFEISNSITVKKGKSSDLDDEFIKKIETNTISKALSRLGFAADIFIGLFDDARYVAEMNAKHGNPEPVKLKPPTSPMPSAGIHKNPLVNVPNSPAGGSLPNSSIPKP